jgi:hypothetical protein
VTLAPPTVCAGAVVAVFGAVLMRPVGGGAIAGAPVAPGTGTGGMGGGIVGLFTPGVSEPDISRQFSVSALDVLS